MASARALLVLCCLAPVTACDPAASGGAGAHEVRSEGTSRGTPRRPNRDAGIDAGRDSGALSSSDAGSGPALDAGIDGGRDAGTDAGRDAGIDGGRDAGSGPSDAGSGCGTWRGPTPIRVLFVGNSQIDFWHLPDIVSDLADSAGASCPRITPTYYTLGGANLRDLWESRLPDGRRLPTTIASGAYEVIVITESIDLAEYRPPYPEQFVDYATRIIDAARAVGSVPILYATSFPEWMGTTGFELMADPQLALGAALDVTVAAGGLAWLRVWAERPDIDLYYTDRAHPNHEGSYISSLVIYSAITGASPIGLDYRMYIDCDVGPCPPIDPVDAQVFQRAAWAQHLATGL